MFHLNVYDGEEKIGHVELGASRVSIGREPDNTLVLPDISVSRRHAQIEPNGNFHVLRDSGSTNGTFVNEMLARTQVLNHGDVIRIGKYTIRIETPRRKDRETTRVRVEPLRLPGKSESPEGERQPVPEGIVFEDDAPLAAASKERLLRLHEIQGEIGYIDRPGALLERALEIIVEELEADRGSVLLCGREISPSDVREADFQAAVVRSRPELLEALGSEAELVIPHEFLARASLQPGGVLESSGAGARTSPDEPGCRMACPLRESKRLRGVVYLERQAGAPAFTGDDLQFLGAICPQVAISVANAELFNEVSLEKEKIHAILTSLTDGIIVTDRSFRVVDANTSAATMLGIEGHIALGGDLFDLFGDFRISPRPEVLRNASPLESTAFHLARRAPDAPSPDSLVLAGRMLPYPRGREAPLGMLVVLRDRSDMQRLEALKTRFIGGIAHKLRTPLTVIQGNLPFLRAESGSTPPPQEILEDMERNSRALSRLVDSFVEYTELELRSLDRLGTPQPLEVKALVQDVVAGALPAAAEKGVIVVERTAQDDCTVFGRRDRIVRALGHVLENAIKFCGEGGRIVVEPARRDGYVQIDFLDDGPGIPRSDIESVFHVCEQVDHDGTGQVPGAGMGLSIARHVLQEHGGDIEIDSPYGFPDHGTRVSVRLPLRGASADDGPAAGRPAVEHAQQEGAR